MSILITTLLLLGLSQAQCFLIATAKLHANGQSTHLGSLTFTQEDADSPVLISGSVSGLNSSSVHGFHIHEKPVATDEPDCASAGPHFNPYGVSHGPPTADMNNRHVGDLGNITTDANGYADVDLSDSIIRLYDTTESIVNRSVVIHLYRDDGGQGGFSDSNTTGNAGARLICGNILLKRQDSTTTTTTEFTPPPTSNTPEHSSTETPDTSTIGPATTTTTSTSNTTVTAIPTSTPSVDNSTVTVSPTTTPSTSNTTATVSSTTTPSTSNTTATPSTSNTTATVSPTTTPSTSNITVTVSPTTTSSTSNTTGNTTKPSAGENLQPVLLLSMVTMIIARIIGA